MESELATVCYLVFTAKQQCRQDHEGSLVLVTVNEKKKLGKISLPKGWFSYVGKISDGWGFYFLPTVPDFADISDIRRKSVPDSPDIAMFMCDRGTGV